MPRESCRASSRPTSASLESRNTEWKIPILERGRMAIYSKPSPSQPKVVLRRALELLLALLLLCVKHGVADAARRYGDSSSAPRARGHLVRGADAQADL